jgi:hypothetical protein
LPPASDLTGLITKSIALNMDKIYKQCQNNVYPSQGRPPFYLPVKGMLKSRPSAIFFTSSAPVSEEFYKVKYIILTCPDIYVVNIC